MMPAPRPRASIRKLAPREASPAEPTVPAPAAPRPEPGGGRGAQPLPGRGAEPPPAVQSASAPPAGWRGKLEPRMREWRRTWYFLKRSRLSMVGLAIVSFYVLLALLAPVLAPTQAGQRNAYDVPPDFGGALQPPGGAHPLGTSVGGLDLWYGIVWGSRISMAMGLSVVGVGVAVGLALGSFAGYKGGWIDDLVLRVTDVFLALPLLILAMAVAIALERSLWSITLALMATWWPPYVRLVRGQALLLREQPYVEAARAAGASDGYILWRHIIPNSLSPVLVQTTLDIGVVVLVAAGLAFLGFSGTNTFTAEWGSLVSIGQNYVAGGQWWTVTFPGLAIFGFVLGFNLLGDGLRDVLDPRLRR